MQSTMREKKQIFRTILIFSVSPSPSHKIEP